MNGDWWCPTCKFTIWGSKAKCLKCGYPKPQIEKVSKPKIVYWQEGDNDTKWDRFGPFSCLKGGYYGKKLTEEPEGLKYPECGCNHLSHCPERHHLNGCHCYTCRGKTHKW